MSGEQVLRMLIMQKRHKLLIFAGLLLLVGCSGSPPMAAMAAISLEPLAARVQTLALLRPTLDGTRSDPFCAPEIGGDIHWQLKQVLLGRGYRVVDCKVPPLEHSNRPDPVASWSSEELRQAAPLVADGIFRLRIVEYLDASLCDAGFELKSLDITAIGEIFARKSGRLLWRTSQSCGELSGRTRDSVSSCVAELTQKIAAQLPPASR